MEANGLSSEETNSALDPFEMNIIENFEVNQHGTQGSTSQTDFRTVTMNSLEPPEDQMQSCNQQYGIPKHTSENSTGGWQFIKRKRTLSKTQSSANSRQTTESSNRNSNYYSILSYSSTNTNVLGSITTEKMKMLDITRDKPIKVAVKVAVPVRDHPKFNFVGKLLGPKGNSMKRLQEDTMCKMAVLGRGSMKDRKKEEELRASGEPRYAHLSEDLHVEISTFAAPAEAHARIAYALAEVRRFLVPDYHDDIRQEQMWEMQALSSSSSQTQTGEQNSPNSLTDLEISCEDKSRLSESMVLGLDSLSDTATTLNGLTGTTTNGISSLANSATESNNQTNFSNATQVNLSAHSVHPSAVAAAIHHQLATAGMGIIKPATGVAAVTGLTPSSQSALGMPSEAETSTPTLALLEPPGALLHPALRGVKTVNIVPLNYFQTAGSLARKRPLLGVPRSSMNPTKRTVMTLLARAKNSQAVHAVRHSGGANIPEPLQMITSPLLLPQPMDETMVAAQKESLSQGV